MKDLALFPFLNATGAFLKEEFGLFKIHAFRQ